MKNIRNKVFETNSSSSHSISIANDSNGILETLPVVEGIVTLTGGCFGWDFEKFNDAQTKADYAAVFAIGDDKLQNMLTDVLREHTGAKKIVYDLTRDWKNDNYSYIDHQSDRSEGGKAFEVFESPEKLKNWIFNPKSWLFIGNDNTPATPYFYDVGPQNYRWILRIEGMELSQKFEKKPGKNKLEDCIKDLMQSHPLCQYSLNKNYELCYWKEKTIDGLLMNSFDKIKNGIITIFQRNAQYDNKGEYLGYQLLDQKDVKFWFEEI